MIVKTLSVDNLSRENIRSKVLKTWLKEEPGAGQHRYNVEVCADGSQIYLIRPAGLNKGCDFIIISENYLKFKNGNDKPPSHADIVELIKSGCKANPSIRKPLKKAINKAYNCVTLNDIFVEFPILLKSPHCYIERSIKLIKWMWIEQDVTYWTGRGREMFYTHLIKLLE